MSAQDRPISVQTGQALIEPSTPAENGGLDNVNYNLIVYENTQIIDPADHIYTVIGTLGSGQFGHVYEVTGNDPTTGLPVHLALKISKSTEESRMQFQYEAQALSYVRSMVESRKGNSRTVNCSNNNSTFEITNTQIRANCDESSMENISYIKEYFEYENHVCILLDKCGPSMLDLLHSRGYCGIPLNHVQSVMRDVLNGLCTLASLDIIHADVKPENITAVSESSLHVKLIDLGSCAVASGQLITYAQSRYYRAPEVVLRLEYDTEADVWSTACVAAELMLGLPLFPAETELHLISLIDGMLGPFPARMIEMTERHDELFMPDDTLKSAEILCAENNENFTEFRPYFLCSRLEDIIMSYPFDEGLSSAQIAEETRHRQVFVDFLSQMLRLDPQERISAAHALEHPFMTMDLS